MSQGDDAASEPQVGAPSRAAPPCAGLSEPRTYASGLVHPAGPTPHHPTNPSPTPRRVTTITGDPSSPRAPGLSSHESRSARLTTATHTTLDQALGLGENPGGRGGEGEGSEGEGSEGEGSGGGVGCLASLAGAFAKCAVPIADCAAR